MPASPKTPTACPIPDAFSSSRETWGDYLRSAQGAAAALVAVVLLMLVAQELTADTGGGSSDAAGAGLGRRGAALARAEMAAAAAAASVPNEPMRGLEARHSISVDEARALYKNIAEHKRQLEGIKIENDGLRSAILRVTGAQIPHRAEPMKPEEILDLLASPHLQGVALQQAAAAGASASASGGSDESLGNGNGGDSGTDFPGFVFYSGMDFDGDDLIHYEDLEDDLPALARACGKTAKCLGFNSQGWLKSSLKPRNKWYRWSNLAKKGIFIKHESVEQLA